MTKLPYFPLYTDDLLGGTLNMSAQEFGCYIRLLCFQWGNGEIPDCQEELQLIAGCAVSPKVMAKFPKCTDGKLRNGRLEQERQQATSQYQKISAARSAAAKNRWQKKAEETCNCNANAYANAFQLHCNCNANQNQNQNQISISKDIDVSAQPLDKPKRAPMLCDADFLEELKKLYPAHNVESELRKMDAWLLTRPGKSKTRKFIVNWLNRADAPMATNATTANDHDRGF